MNKFVFRPVGQGLFYTGSIADNRYNFVYDCGTESNQTLLNTEIQCYKNELFDCHTSTIDFVVISHLHRDHFSGLYKLAQSCCIKKIYLPYLGFFTKDVLQLYLVYELFVRNGDAINLQENSLYRLMASLYLDDGNGYREYVEDVRFVSDAKQDECIVGGELLWEFKFLYNQISATKIAEINQSCKNLLNSSNCLTIEEFIGRNKQNIDKIARAYRTVFGKGNALNNTSIILLHYPANITNHIYNYRCYKSRNWFGCCKNIHEILFCNQTLLTGDIRFNSAISATLKQYIINEKVAVLQVPHHGAKGNWQSCVDNNIYADLYVIPFGYGNKYRHPHKEVIDYLISHNNEFYCVTQACGFVYFIG